MSLRKCRSCGYWVQPETRACGNCGILAPTAAAKSMNEGVDTTRYGSILLCATAGLVAGIGLGVRSSGGDLIVLLVWSLSGVLGGWLVGDLLNNVLSPFITGMKNRLSPTHTTECLRTEEQKIRQSLIEATRRAQMVRAAQIQTARQGAAEDSAEMVALAERDREMGAQIAALQGRLWEIAAERWDNQLDWISEDASGLSDRDCGVRLQVLSAAGVRIEALLKNWEASPYATTDNGRACIRRMRALLDRRDAIKPVLQARSGTQPRVSVMPSLNISRPAPAPVPELPPDSEKQPVRPEPRAAAIDPVPHIRLTRANDPDDDDARLDQPLPAPVLDLPGLTIQRTRRRLV